MKLHVAFMVSMSVIVGALVVDLILKITSLLRMLLWTAVHRCWACSRLVFFKNIPCCSEKCWAALMKPKFSRTPGDQ